MFERWKTYRIMSCAVTDIEISMNKSALQDIQQALNAIRSGIECADDDTKWAALELMLDTSSSVVALARKMAKPETKTVTRTVAVPKTKIVKQEPQW